jgi:transposase
LRLPNKPKSNKKRKIGYQNQKTTAGTTTDHFMKFLEGTMDELGKLQHMQNCYLIMDNAPIHTRKSIEEYINQRKYRCIYLPPYSPELNPIEQFWSVAKSKLKRCALLHQETLSSRITEACNDISISYLRGFINHSVKRFDDCVNKIPM